ncbi:MAG TPA: NAD-dependent epimerase/dehydratase family protein [Gemmatimonadaceae bacterium]|nr:NAD-dependent epimerase/dehydratase family protein [Gemmatimonadaceae bacterium]
MSAPPQNERELDALLSEPRAETAAALARVPGDIVILGAGGKMGPTLAHMAARAARDAGTARRVIAVSRFSSARAAHALSVAGIETLTCDLLDREAVRALPDAPNVVFMAGQKFGTSDAPSRTWMMNVVVPAHCAERYADSRIVAFSTGNVYPLVKVSNGGARETDATAPVGEYAESCLGRERVFEHFAATRGTRVAIVRLNYAIDLRYGVLADIAMNVMAGAPVSLTMGYVNVIWQRDASRAALELLPHAASPPLVLNVTGSATLSVRELASAIGERLGKTPKFTGTEANDALLSNTSRMQQLLSPFDFRLGMMLDWVADWVRNKRPMLGRPTHFETRDGAF